MQRRGFLGGAGAAMVLGGQPLAAYQMRFRQLAMESEVVVEKEESGRPHAGKVLAAVAPHSDDISLFAAGTVLKLIREGYTGILIRTPMTRRRAPERLRPR